MRIVLFGQAAFGVEVFKRILERGEEVVAVYCPPDGPGGRVDPLKEEALTKGVKVLQPKSMKDPAVLEEYKSLNSEINVLAFVTAIIPKEILNHPPLGSIQYHPSLLPKHRGRSAINWAVIQGERKTGLTIFWVDEGIDTGPILLQKEVEIDPDDTTGSLYFNKLFPLGVEAMMKALELVKAGKALKIPQDETQATYEPPCDAGRAWIDWRRPLQEIYDLIRGCDPQPGAWSTIRGERFRFYSPKRVEKEEESPRAVAGSVLEVRPEGLVLAVRDGRLLVGKVRPPGGSKMTAEEFATQWGIKAGDRFGT